MLELLSISGPAILVVATAFVLVRRELAATPPATTDLGEVPEVPVGGADWPPDRQSIREVSGGALVEPVASEHASFYWPQNRFGSTDREFQNHAMDALLWVGTPRDPWYRVMCWGGAMLQAPGYPQITMWAAPDMPLPPLAERPTSPLLSFEHFPAWARGTTCST